ncbi:unnamed protein product [Sympodiomycopsis kandeliae]
MSSPSESSPPLFPGDQAGAGNGNGKSPSSSSNGAGGSSSPTRLWLLFLIPIVILAFLLGIAVWYINRRKRRAKARRSTLRNVTLIIQEEEKERDREEKRLARGDSVASKVLRRDSTLKEKRQQRYSKRIARAVAQERKQATSSFSDTSNLTQPHPSNSSAAAADQDNSMSRSPPPPSRKASIKHRDREIAQRVWRVPGSAMGDRPLNPRNLTRDLEAAGALRSQPDDDSGADQSDKDTSDVEGSSIGHIRPTVIRRRDEPAMLSIIGESGVSNDRSASQASEIVPGDPSTEVENDKSKSTTTITPIAASKSASASDQGVGTSSAAAAAGAGAGGILLGRNMSQRSGLTVATSQSRYTTAEDTDAQSMQTAETGGTIMPAQTSEQQQQQQIAEPEQEMRQQTPSSGAVDSSTLSGTPLPGPAESSSSSGTPRAAPAVLPPRRDSDLTDPFRSPDTAGTASTGTNPFSDSRGATLSSPPTASEPLPPVPQIIKTEDTPPLDKAEPVAGDNDKPVGSTDRPLKGSASTVGGAATGTSSGVSLVRKLSDVVRLKTPTPRRHRSPSPGASTGSTAGGTRRSMSNSSKSSRGAVAAGSTSAQGQDLTLRKTPSSPRARFFRRGTAADPLPSPSPSTSSPLAQRPLPPFALKPGDNWTYTSRASEWKRSSVPNVNSTDDPSGLEAPNPPFLGKIRHRSQSSSSLGRPGKPESRSGSSSASSGPPIVPGERIWIGPERVSKDVDRQAATEGEGEEGAGALNVPGATGVQRKPSVGASGSRFKETFD